MAFGGVALKGVSLFIRFIQFCCAAIILAISCYYLAVLHNHGLHIATYIRAVTGISGFGVLYSIFGLVLVCCLGGISFFSFLGILFDLAFAGAFIYIAWAYRKGTDSCTGHVDTPLGSGDEKSEVANGKGGFTHLPSLHTACKMETAAFAVALDGIFFFIISIFVEMGLIRHHKKEKAFGPSPNNGYTAGSPKRKFWQRSTRRRDTEMAGGLAAKQHPDSLPVHSTPNDVRASYATDTTAVDKYAHTTPVGGSNMPTYHQTSGTNF